MTNLLIMQDYGLLGTLCLGSSVMQWQTQQLSALETEREHKEISRSKRHKRVKPEALDWLRTLNTMRQMIEEGYQL